MSVSMTQLGYQALRDIGCLRPGGTTSPDVLNDVLIAGNQMLDSFLVDELMVFTVADNIYNLTGGLQTYNIGPGQVAPNFNTARPTRIVSANVIINTVSPVVRRPLKLYNHQEWAAVRVRGIPFALPLELYYDLGFDATNGFGTINLWPGPLSSYQLELFTWQQLQNFPDLTTVLKFPPGYELLLRKNLGVMIAPMMRVYAKIPGPGGIRSYDESMLSMVAAEARRSKATVQSYNANEALVGVDDAFLSSDSRRGAWNYIIGEYS